MGGAGFFPQKFMHFMSALIAERRKRRKEGRKEEERKEGRKKEKKEIKSKQEREQALRT